MDMRRMWRYRTRILPTDSMGELTHGHPIGGCAILSYLRMDYSTYSGIALPGKSNTPLIGQINFFPGDQNARLSFIAPDNSLESGTILALMDHLCWESGARGALRLLIESDEDHPLVEMLRFSSFNIYSKQQIWKFTAAPQTGAPSTTSWRPFQPIDQHNLNSLYHAVVPPLIQSAEGTDKKPFHGLVHYSDGELQAFAEMMAGPRGIYLIPVIHPNIREVESLLVDLITNIIFSPARPLYIAIRDHQCWLNNIFDRSGAEAGNRKALLVRHLVKQQKIGIPITLRNVLNGHRTETTRSFTPHASIPDEISNDIIATK